MRTLYKKYVEGMEKLHDVQQLLGVIRLMLFSLVVDGPGKFSLDHLLTRRRSNRRLIPA